MNISEAIAEARNLLVDAEARIASQLRLIARIERVGGDTTHELGVLDLLIQQKERQQQQLDFLRQWLGNSN